MGLLLTRAAGEHSIMRDAAHDEIAKTKAHHKAMPHFLGDLRPFQLFPLIQCPVARVCGRSISPENQPTRCPVRMREVSRRRLHKDGLAAEGKVPELGDTQH